MTDNTQTDRFLRIYEQLDRAQMDTIRDHRGHQQKYDYLLIAVACAAIALVVERTTGISRSWDLLLLLAAVGCWTTSFLYGCWRQGALDAHLAKENEKIAAMKK